MALTQRYVRADANGSGDGTTDANSGSTGAWTISQMVTNVTAGMQVNIKAGVYTRGASAVATSSLSTTASTPVVYKGFKNIPGDMDDFAVSHGTFMSGTEVPAFSFTTGTLSLNHSHAIIMNLDVSGSPTSGVLAMAGQSGLAWRCRVENTSSNIAARAMGGSAAVIGCWLKVPATASFCLVASSGSRITGNVVEGGLTSCVDINGNVATTITNNIFINATGNGVTQRSASSKLTVVSRNLFRCNGIGVSFTTVGNEGHEVSNNIFDSCSVGIDNSSGAVGGPMITRYGNLFYNCLSGTEVGFGDTPSYSNQIDTASPLANSAGRDFRLLSTSNGHQKFTPSNFEALILPNYANIGPWQRDTTPQTFLVIHT